MAPPVVVPLVPPIPTVPPDTIIDNLSARIFAIQDAHHGDDDVPSGLLLNHPAILKTHVGDNNPWSRIPFLRSRLLKNAVGDVFPSGFLSSLPPLPAIFDNEIGDESPSGLLLTVPALQSRILQDTVGADISFGLLSNLPTSTILEAQIPDDFPSGLLSTVPILRSRFLQDDLSTPAVGDDIPKLPNIRVRRCQSGSDLDSADCRYSRDPHDMPSTDEPAISFADISTIYFDRTGNLPYALFARHMAPSPNGFHDPPGDVFPKRTPRDSAPPVDTTSIMSTGTPPTPAPTSQLPPTSLLIPFTSANVSPMSNVTRVDDPFLEPPANVAPISVVSCVDDPFFESSYWTSTIYIWFHQFPQSNSIEHVLLSTRPSSCCCPQSY
jgi:hypothetical protein